MRKEGKKNGIRILLISALCLCLLGACNGKAGDEGQSGNGNLFGRKELPEDTPWNHGQDAVMETENGYYSSMMTAGYQAGLCLRYYDKETGATTLLCNKPECQHEGDASCEATYMGVRVINTALYEGAIYVLGKETSGGMVSINLYKAALNGSAMDKVGTVISEALPVDESGNPQEVTFQQKDAYDEIYQEIEYGFILHKGFAYIPYFLRFGKGMKGFQGGGLVKMDVKTGEKKEIYSLENPNQGVPARLMAQGDYVWFRVYLNHKGSRIKRYCISKDEIEDYFGNGYVADDPETKSELLAPLLGEGRVYDVSYSLTETLKPQNTRFLAYDLETGKYKPEELIDTGREFRRIADAFVYEKQIFWGDLYGLYAVDVMTREEKALPFPEEKAGIDLQRKGADHSLKKVRYKLSNGTLYLLFWDEKDVRYMTGGYGYRKRVFACPLEDFNAGKGTWTEIFTVEGSAEGEKFE